MVRARVWVTVSFRVRVGLRLMHSAFGQMRRLTKCTLQLHSSITCSPVSVPTQLTDVDTIRRGCK